LISHVAQGMMGKAPELSQVCPAPLLVF